MHSAASEVRRCPHRASPPMGRVFPPSSTTNQPVVDFHNNGLHFPWHCPARHIATMMMIMMMVKMVVMVMVVIKTQANIIRNNIRIKTKSKTRGFHYNGIHFPSPSADSTVTVLMMVGTETSRSINKRKKWRLQKFHKIVKEYHEVL